MTCDFFINEQWGMLEANHKEIAGEDSVFDPDLSVYRAMEANGNLVLVALYADDELVGYSSVVSMNDLHMKGIVRSKIDSIFILPEHRSYKAFRFMVTEIEKLLTAVGANTVSFTSNTKRPIDKILKRFKYVPEETVLMKDLQWV